jgi:hypothetical protein
LTGNVVREQDVVNAAAHEEGKNAENGFRVPSGLSKRHRSLLMATPEERACRVVGVLRWVLCKEGYEHEGEKE